jgi:predicted ribosome quality control (RQC) complex YloA/Tae2 family protein
MDSLSLLAVADELRPATRGRRLGAVLVPAREQMAISLGLGRALFLSINGADARLHLVEAMPEAPRHEPSIQTRFDSLLRGAEVLAVEVPDFDRVLHLDLANVDRVGTPRRLRLVVELMGKHSACVLLDEAGLIAATLKTVSHAVNRHRELLPKLPYVPPPGGERRDPLTIERAAWDEQWPAIAGAPSLRQGWRGLYFGLSDELWAWLCQRAELAVDAAGDVGGETLWGALEALRQIVDARAWQPCVRRDEQGLPVAAWPLPLPGGEPMASISEALALVAAHAGERGELKRRRGELLAAADRALHRVDSGLKGIARAAERAAQIALWRHQGDLLLANLTAIAPRAAAVTLPDWQADGAEVTIALDPRLNGPRNAEALYDRARRAARAAEEAPGREPALRAEQERLLALRQAILAAAAPSELHALADRNPDLTTGSAVNTAAKPRTERDRWMAKLERRVSPDGYTILIGRNALESEGLLSRVAAPSDLWFHVRGAGSGHVIVRTEGRPESVPAGTIEDAARWAARHSKMKHSGLVPVVYTQRKYVTKVTGGAAGKVVYRHEKSIFVEP